MKEQMIFKRYEIKYLLTPKQLAEVKDGMAEHMIPDIHGQSTVCSLYYDTPDFLLARRSLERPVYKEKLRLRSYGLAEGHSPVFVELKKKYQSVVYKRRVEMDVCQAKDYLLRGKGAPDTQIAREIDYALKLYQNLRPAVFLSYEREAFYDRTNHEFRVTFDNDILWRDYSLDPGGGIFGAPLLPKERTLMEIKTADAVPLWFARILSGCLAYRTSFSKYGSAYAAICQRQKETAEGGLSEKTA